MIESEARLKRCCGPEGCGYPNGSDTVLTAESTIEIPTRYCIASDCMAWRKCDHKGNPCKFDDYKGHGYCGLAGKP